jgi:excisionase family DNA binding protein
MEPLLTLEEAAALVKVTPRTVRDWIRRGKLPGVKLQKQWRVRTQDLEAFVQASMIVPSSPDDLPPHP